MNENYKFIIFLLLLNFCSIVICTKLELNKNLISSNVVKIVKDFKNRNINEENKFTYVFNGLQKHESVPVRFPKDICLMRILNEIYAASLYSDGENGINFVIFKYENEKYNPIYNQSTPLAISMDCKEFNEKGYIAIAYNLTSRPRILKNGSPIFEIENDEIEIIQYFAEPHLTSIQFNIRGDSLFLVQTNRIQTYNLNEMKLNCPIYKLDGTHFDLINRIPCKNSKRIATFTINSKIFIAIANYADEYNRTDTESYIYKYDVEENLFKLFQKIETYAVVDVDYFHVHQNDETQHFLVFANSKQKGTTTEEDSSEAYSVIYKYENDNFVPFQKLLLYEVQQFLQVQSGINEFMLLVACDDQDIKLFQYNGWKFEESAVQLTEGSLGKGISNMRYFDDLNETYIVIANENMLLNEPNIFKPIYKKIENATDIKMDILEWSKEIYKKHSNININKLINDLELTKYPSETIINGTSYLKFKTAIIENAFVNKLIYPKKNITTNFWNKIIKVQKLLKKLKIKIINLNKKIQLKYSIKYESENENENIFKSSNITKNISYLLENQLNNNSYIETLTIENLLIKSNIQVNKINGISIGNNNNENNLIKIDQINATKILIKNSTLIKYPTTTFKKDTRQINKEKEIENLTENYINLKVNKLHVTGKINNIDFNLLYKNLLKKIGDQELIGPINIKNLTANSIKTNNKLINGWNTSKLVKINNKNEEYVVNQDIQFAAPLIVKNLNVENRINNIHILNNQLDVLLNDRNEMQKITGIKIFDEIDLLEPIHIGGKIVGSQIDKVSPYHSLHDNYILTGDYTIHGNVTIENKLHVKDIIGIKSKEGLHHILENGLRLNYTEISVKMNFLNEISTKNINLKIINNINSETFLKNDINTLIQISGKKIFTGNVNIEGKSNIKEINGINLNNFEENILTISGEQSIMEPIYVDKIIVPNISSKDITLGALNLQDILTKDSEQKVYGKVSVENLIVKNINADNLVTKKLIFGETVNNFKLENINENENIINSSKVQLYDNIKVKKLEIRNNLNHLSIKLIEELMKKLNENVPLIGPIYFKNNIDILKLQFNGNLNGIIEKKFGKIWLLKGIPQKFMAPQTFENIQCDQIEVNDKVNNISIKEFYNNTYWLNKDEHIEHLNFDSIVEVKNINLKNLNNEHFPNGFLLSNNTTYQNINHLLAQNIYVNGNLKFDNVNNLNIHDFENFIKYNDKRKVAIEYGIFDEMPNIETINNKYWKNLIEEVWLKDAVKTILLKPMKFESIAITKNSINFEDFVNNVNLSYVRDHYISKSKAQKITTDIKFSNQISFEDKLETSIMNINGNIINSYDSSNTPFNLNHFVKKALKLSENQTITGQWNLNQIYIEGDLNDVSINGLNFINDVLRYDNVKSNNITAKKYFKNLKIEKIYSNIMGKINNINITNWLRNTVYVYDNFTINGQTIIDKSIIINNIMVLGLTNTISFKKDNLLLKVLEQNLKECNLKIITKNLDKEKISSNTIENLQVEKINGRSINKLLNNLNNNINNITVYGDLIFNNNINIDNFNGNNNLYFEINTKEYFNKLLENSLELKAEINFQNLSNKLKKIRMNYEDSKLSFYLKTFETLQSIYGNIKKVISWTISYGNQFLDYIIVLSGSENNLKISFYEWNMELKLFILDTSNRWNSISEYLSIFNIDKVSMKGLEFLVIETYFDDKYHQHFLSFNENGLSKIHEIHSNSSKKFLITTDDRNLNVLNCLHTYSKADSILSQICPNLENTILLKWSFHLPFVTQVIYIEKTVFATMKSNSIEIRDLSKADVTHQRISIINPIYIDITQYNEDIFLAITCSKQYSSSIYSGSVEIYKSSNKFYFKQLQTLHSINVVKAKFQKITKSGDLLLHVLANNMEIPLATYHYKGIIGFQQIIASSTIPKGFDFQTLNLGKTSKYMIGVQHSRGLNLIELVLGN